MPRLSKSQRRKLTLAHRYVGVGSALFVVMLSITGMMLNHTESLSLDERHVQSPSLLNIYGIEAPEIGSSYQVETLWISQIGKQLYLDERVVTTMDKTVLGAVATENVIIVASTAELLLITREGELVERLTILHGIPNHIQRIGLDATSSLPLLRNSDGVFIGDRDLFEWRASETKSGHWSNAAQLPQSITTKIERSYLGNGLTLERVVLDLHSGRIAGQVGVLFMDLIALLFLFLAAVGVWMWFKPKKT